MTLHPDEVGVGPDTVAQLLAEQCPQWSGLPLSPAGEGTDNTMYRLGSGLLVRLPRTPTKAANLAKEQRWLPWLASRLDCLVPQPLHAGAPGSAFPLAWAVYRWIDGAPPSPDSVRDWAAFGARLAEVVRQLHGAGLDGASRDGELAGYRGGSLAECTEWFAADLSTCRTLPGLDLDLDTLAGLWQAGLDAGEPTGPDVLLHSDLKPSNLLVRDGELVALIDFGGLTIGRPDAEHATIWDLPAPARSAYRDALGLDEPTWARARAWAVLVGVSGVAYYWHTYPAFVAECRARLTRMLAAS